MKNLVICLCFLTCQYVHTFNLESRLPIIKYGEADSYFGYSVAEHVTGNKEDIDNVKWLLVGAPLGQNLQPNTNRSGALWKCPITQNYDDCVQVITDGKRSMENDDLSEPLYDLEIKNGQWMGVTVRSQGPGGKVLVCAHRYISKAGESQYGQGLCYVLTNELQHDDTYELCKGRSTKREHEDYSYCQVGTSGVLLDDGTMVVGSPGLYTWRGTIFVLEVGGEYLKRDKNHYYGPHDENSSPVDKYSYLGMAVTGGSYFGGHMSYAAGAPRSSGHGQVVIFSKGIPDKTNPIPYNTILDGEQFASSFGYELATADINGDGFPDLLVAAPFYFSRDEGGAVYVYQNDNHSLPKLPTLKLTGKPESHFGLAIANIGDINKDRIDDIAIGAPYEDDGVVYIYLGSVNGLSKEPVQRIAASDLKLVGDRPITTFGSSLSGGIDLDNNTYPDLLVGAYASATAIGLLSRPITNIKTEVRTPDFTLIDATKIGCVSDLESNLTCFSFQACCSIEPYETSSTKPLDLVYTIEAEIFNNRKFSRVFFGPDFKKRSNVVKRNIQVMTNGEMDCHREIVYVKENTRDIQNPIKFRLNYTIVEAALPSSGLQYLNPILDQTEAKRVIEIHFQKDCGSDDICESELELNAELQLNKDDTKDGNTLVLNQSNEIHLNVSVTNHKDSAYEAQLFVEHQPRVSYVSYIAASRDSVSCNRFNETFVICALANPLKRETSANVLLRFNPKGLEDTELKLSFRIFANTTSNEIFKRPDTLLSVRVVKRAEVSILGRAYPEQSFYSGEMKGESSMKYLSDIGGQVEHIYQIYNDGPWRVPFIEVFVSWPHQVANDKPQGKWLLYLEEKPTLENSGGGECNINPINLINPLDLSRRLDVNNNIGAPEAYMRRNVNKSHSFVASSSMMKTSAKFASTSTINRVKRDRAMIIKPEQLVDKDGKKTEIVHMDCAKGTAKCIQFSCEIYNLNKEDEAFIRVKARLWNATLVSDYPRVDHVDIVSRAEIRIPDVHGIQQQLKDDMATISTRAYPELLDQVGDYEVPLWVWIISILGGLLLLALVALILYKCNFFSRTRPDPTLSGNLEKSSESKPFISK